MGHMVVAVEGWTGSEGVRRVAMAVREAAAALAVAVEMVELEMMAEYKVM